ncbi:MAG TPA: hypothetical protein VLB29_04705 [Nocardioidaceae bacterium]|nr:hypothetical protein [Nocardioidaceae bacterium]
MRLRAGGTTVAVAAVVLLTAGCSEQEQGARDERPDGRLVLVSGRDDHGERKLEAVSLYDTPAQDRVVGRVADGTLARVRHIDGQMLEVVTAEGEPVTGWVDDFYLRGALHLVGQAPSCRARLGGSLQEAGLQVVVMGVRNGEVLVQSAADAGLRGWAARDLVQELPPRGQDCSGEPAESKHSH